MCRTRRSERILFDALTPPRFRSACALTPQGRSFRSSVLYFFISIIYMFRFVRYVVCAYIYFIFFFLIYRFPLCARCNNTRPNVRLAVRRVSRTSPINNTARRFSWCIPLALTHVHGSALTWTSRARRYGGSAIILHYVPSRQYPAGAGRFFFLRVVFRLLPIGPFQRGRGAKPTRIRFNAYYG